VLPEVLVFNGGATQFAVSENGTAVVGLSAVGAQDRELVIVAFDGSENPLPFRGNFNHPRFDPDGRRIAYESGRQIEVYDRVTGAVDVLAIGNNYQSPWWSRDGRYVYYSGFVGGSVSYDVVRRLANLSEEEELLYQRGGNDFPLALSLDGSLLLLEASTPDRGRDMVLMTQGPDSAVFSDYLRGIWNETSGTLSPDGRWLAYVSDESGQQEIYIRAFPAQGGKWQVSTDGGFSPRWSPDGTELFYRWQSELYALAVDGRAGSFRASGREVVFDDLPIGSGGIDYDLIDSDRFLIVETAGDDDAPPGVTVVVNWLDDLKRRVPN